MFIFFVIGKDNYVTAMDRRTVWIRQLPALVMLKPNVAPVRRHLLSLTDDMILDPNVDIRSRFQNVIVVDLRRCSVIGSVLLPAVSPDPIIQAVVVDGVVLNQLHRPRLHVRAGVRRVGGNVYVPEVRNVEVVLVMAGILTHGNLHVMAQIVRPREDNPPVL